MSLLEKHIASSSPKEIYALKELFTEFVLEKEKFIEKTLALTPVVRANFSVDGIQNGMMTRFALMNLLFQYPSCKNKGVSSAIFDHLANNCVKSSILTDINYGDGNAIMINRDIILRLILTKSLEGAIVLSHRYNINKNKNSMVKICVQKEDLHIGSGFVVTDPRPDRQDTYIATAKHNVQLESGKINSIEIENTGNIDLSQVE